MIDIHHHCLPDVDDGPREWDEALAMCRAAADEGIETIIATPHVLRGRWKTFSREQLEERVALLNERSGGTPRVVLGSEYFFGHDMAEVLREGKAIVPLASSRYVLFELTANSVPPLIERPLYRSQLEGWIPIVAHPERNLVFQRRPELLAELVEHGVRVQVTAASLTGGFGADARASAKELIRRRLVHFLATDAHNMTRRPPQMREAAAVVAELAGRNVADALTRENPLAVLENRALPWQPEPVERFESGFFTRLRSFFSSRQV